MLARRARLPQRGLPALAEPQWLEWLACWSSPTGCWVCAACGVNGIQLKLGRLGKVVGFSILSLNIGSLQSFDAAQTQDLLRSLTMGLGVALLTKMVGLVYNILLGLQLRRLDRYADLLVADIQRPGLAQQRASDGDAA